MIAEICAGSHAGEKEIGLKTALNEVEPGGHFFGSTQTMERYPTEFYEPILHDYSNFGTWSEGGRIDSNQRATKKWKTIVSNQDEVIINEEKLENLENFIYRRTKEGGSFPVS